MMPSWEKIRRRIRERIPEHCYRMWIEPVALAGTGPGSVTLASPNAFMSRRLETVYLLVIREALAGEGLAGVRVRFTEQAGRRTADQGKAEAAPEPAVVRRQQHVPAAQFKNRRLSHPDLDGGSDHRRSFLTM